MLNVDAIMMSALEMSVVPTKHGSALPTVSPLTQLPPALSLYLGDVDDVSTAILAVGDHTTVPVFPATPSICVAESHAAVSPG